jgi:hypothetical protein
LPAIDAARLFGTVGVAFALAVDRTIADMGGHVFISYSRTDRGYVVDLAKQLDATGIEVWYDFELAVGERFDATIQHKIDTCAAFIVVLTRDAAASEWVVREIAYAQHRNKPVLPLLLSSCDLPITLIRVHHEDVTSGQMPGSSINSGHTPGHPAVASNHRRQARPGAPVMRRAEASSFGRLHHYRGTRRGRRWITICPPRHTRPASRPPATQPFRRAES